MLSPQRAAQLGLGSVIVMLVLCMGVLIVNGKGIVPDAGTTPASMSASNGSTVSPATGTLASASGATARN